MRIDEINELFYDEISKAEDNQATKETIQGMKTVMSALNYRDREDKAERRRKKNGV
jgi:hypothetical protein